MEGPESTPGLNAHLVQVHRQPEALRLKGDILWRAAAQVHGRRVVYLLTLPPAPVRLRLAGQLRVAHDEGRGGSKPGAHQRTEE